MNFKSLPQLLIHFQEEQTCIEYLEQQRWDGTPICPHCGHDRSYKLKKGYKCANNECYKKFTVKVGTIFENSKVKLSLWFAAIYLCTAHKKGTSSLQLHRDLGVTQKTAWFMLHRIREMMREKNPTMLEGTSQVDETYVGGKIPNKDVITRKKHAKGELPDNKAGVLGATNGKEVRMDLISDTNMETLEPLIEAMIKKGEIVVSDGLSSYNFLSKKYKHKSVNHSEGEYVKHGFHTNSIEGFWSILKRGIIGIYHFVSPEHLIRYCNEFAYRYNTRQITDGQRFNYSLTRVEGGVSYKKLTKKLD